MISWHNDCNTNNIDLPAKKMRGGAPMLRESVSLNFFGYRCNYMPNKVLALARIFT